MWNSSDGWVRLAHKKKKSFKRITRIHSVPFFYPEPINLKQSKWEPCHDLPHPSVVSLVFCHRSSENPLPLLFDLFPNLHFHFTSALLPPPPLKKKPLVHSYHKMWSLFPYHFDLWPQSCEYACAVCPYTQLFIWHLTSETGWYLKKKKKVWPLLLPFPMSFICRIFFTLFCSHFCLFCPC